MASETEAMVLGQRRATVETTLRETQEENDEFRRRILGLEQQLKEARGLAEGGEAVEARLRDKVHRLEVTLLSILGQGLPALLSSTFLSHVPSCTAAPQYSAISLECPHALCSHLGQFCCQCALSFSLTVSIKLGFVSCTNVV